MKKGDKLHVRWKGYDFLPTTSALTAFENKIPNASSLVKKQIMIQRLLKSKKSLLIIITINILLLQSLIL